MNNQLFILLISFLFLNCINNIEDQIPEITDEIISYASQIQPVFNNSCGGAGCHTNGGNANGVNLNNYQTTINSVGASYGILIVIPDSADISPLVDKLRPNPENGNQMPLSGSISSSDIGNIIAWINQGAQDN